MLKGLTLWLLRRYFKGYCLFDLRDGMIVTGTIDIGVIRSLLHHYAPGHHLTRSAGKGSRIAKRKAMAEAQKQAIQEYYTDPQAETLGD